MILNITTLILGVKALDDHTPEAVGATGGTLAGQDGEEGHGAQRDTCLTLGLGSLVLGRAARAAPCDALGRLGCKF